MDEFQKIIELELKKMSKEEREIFRRDSLRGLYELISKTKASMESFDKTILKSIDEKVNEVNLKTILVREEKQYLYEEGYSEIIVNNEKSLVEVLETEDKILKRVFIDDSFIELEKINGRRMKAYLLVKSTKHLIECQLEYDDSIIKRLEFLHEVFSLNNIKWKSYNVPYARKFFRVKAISFNKEILTQLDGTETLEIDAEDLSGKWLENHVLMWNIKETKVNGDGLVKPTQNRIHYEHTILLENIENVYLVPTDHHIYYISKPDTETLKVITSEAGEILWNLIIIKPSEGIDLSQTKHRYFSNQRDLNFVNKLKMEREVRIRNIGELKRIVHSFPKIREYFRFIGAEVKEEIKEELPLYKLNSFIVDEFSLKGKLTYLELTFDFLKEDIYTLDMLSFLISEIQLYFPEYKCVGVRNE